jgi:Zn-dependent peptidase ImmA (M78 family)
LSRKRITQIADSFLCRHGLEPGSYTPPTPIELLVDEEPDIYLRFDQLDARPGNEPYVLGMTRWSFDGKKEIIINGALDDADNTQSEYRLLFTLGHELFHAIEHLPLMDGQPDAYFHTVHDPGKRRSGMTRAQRALEQWRASTGPRLLNTPEDWREWQAQQFSASILMPEWALRQELCARDIAVPVITDDPRTVALELATSYGFADQYFEEPLHQTFRVSGFAMAVRLLSLGLVGEAAM